MTDWMKTLFLRFLYYNWTDYTIKDAEFLFVQIFKFVIKSAIFRICCIGSRSRSPSSSRKVPLLRHRAECKAWNRRKTVLQVWSKQNKLNRF